MEEAVRVREPNRKQVVLHPTDLDALIDREHPARAIWRVLEGLDLSRFYAPIKARESSPARDASDPRMLLALWLYALSEGISSAREVERLCEAHAAYRWICGGVGVNYHTLSDFRSGHGAALDELFTQVVGMLMAQHLITLYRVAQDGTRVRASAGAASFRRKARLKACLRTAREHLEQLTREAEADPTQCSARQQAAEMRAAREYQQRVAQALSRSNNSVRIRQARRTIRSARPKPAPRALIPKRG